MSDDNSYIARIAGFMIKIHETSNMDLLNMLCATTAGSYRTDEKTDLLQIKKTLYRYMPTIEEKMLRLFEEIHRQFTLSPQTTTPTLTPGVQDKIAYIIKIMRLNWTDQFMTVLSRKIGCPYFGSMQSIAEALPILSNETLDAIFAVCYSENLKTK